MAVVLCLALAPLLHRDCSPVADQLLWLIQIHFVDYRAFYGLGLISVSFGGTNTLAKIR
jgi:hypothetical protein